MTAATIALLVAAATGGWHFNFNQGIAEYAVGDFREGRDNLALYCAEGGFNPGQVSVTLNRAGMAGGGPATFVTDTGKVTLTLDREGTATFPTLAAAPQFRTLWRLLATGRSLEVRFGPGAPLRFPLTGTAKLLGRTPCPKQLAS